MLVNHVIVEHMLRFMYLGNCLWEKLFQTHTMRKIDANFNFRLKNYFLQKLCYKTSELRKYRLVNTLINKFYSLYKQISGYRHFNTISTLFSLQILKQSESIMSVVRTEITAVAFTAASHIVSICFVVCCSLRQCTYQVSLF